MFTYLLTRHGDLETAACWTPLFARGVQSSVSCIETTKGNIRFKPQRQFSLLCPGMGSNDKNVSWEEGNSHGVPDMSLGAELHQRVLLAAVYQAHSFSSQCYDFDLRILPPLAFILFKFVKVVIEIK
jgi:hypothetical protein